jgi:hypothetical protein
MPPLPPELTHQLYARYRFRNTFTLEKVGRTTYEIDPQTGLILAARSIIKLMPVGGFDGFMLGLPLDAEPSPRPQPKRTAQPQLDEEAMQDEALYNSLYSANHSQQG